MSDRSNPTSTPPRSPSRSPLRGQSNCTRTIRSFRSAGYVRCANGVNLTSCPFSVCAISECRIQKSSAKAHTGTGSGCIVKILRRKSRRSFRCRHVCSAWSNEFHRNDEARRFRASSLVVKARSRQSDLVLQWPLWTSFFKSGDVIVSETGTSNFGILDVRLPSKTTLTSQVLYGSIGWACGATLGAAMAAQEQGRRCILFTGDGSM